MTNPLTDDSRWTVRAITTDHSDNIHHLICRDCSAEYRGVPNACPHCQDGWMH